MSASEKNPRFLDVVAAVIERRGRWLVARRPGGKRHGGCWEFPGGKLLPGESLEAGARRELAEELGVRVAAVREVLCAIHDRGSPYRVCFCRVEIEGEPRALEHEELRWLDEEELEALPLAPSDRAFFREFLAGGGGGVWPKPELSC